MSNILGLLILLLAWSNQGTMSFTVRKIIYQKDMSEHCRRRVIPSVFLGRQVVEAHSQIFHFSRLELPYSCFISIRAESGSGIVLVVQLLSEESLRDACSENSNQLLVYDMGETFGGYWGNLPDSALKHRPQVTKLYERKKTLPTSTSVSEEETDDETSDSESQEKPRKTQPIDNKEDFIRYELPIVNVSASRNQPFNPKETFDISYDVTPWAVNKYMTKSPPMVHFAIWPRYSRKGGEKSDYHHNLPTYTADSRLTFSHYGPKTTKRQQTLGIKSYYDKLLNYKTVTTNTRPAKEKLYFKNDFLLKDPEISLTSTTARKPFSSNKSDFTRSLSKSSIFTNWEDIAKRLKNLNESTSYLDKFQNESINISRILDTVASMKNNYSVFLGPNWSSLADYENNTNYINVTQRFVTFTKKPINPGLLLFSQTSSLKLPAFRSTENIPHLTENAKTTINTSTKVNNMTHKEVNTAMPKHKETTSTLITNIDVSSKHSGVIISYRRNDSEVVNEETSEITQPAGFVSYTVSSATNENVKLKGTSAHVTKFLSSTPFKGSTVGYESWENVVQAAPVMAVVLNKTAFTPNNIINATKEKISRAISTTTNKKIRKKRTIQSIPIENAQPHHVITRKSLDVTTPNTLEIADVENFAQYVELEDDKLHDRAALRYLRQYVGQSLLNLCDSGEPKARYVYLFNSSRVVIAIDNFTLDRMTVMLTPARTLRGGGVCAPATLECQVYGTRICVDSINACDGVPNCGAYDIYDEDRLMCGAALGLQHNVFLAAIAFLAVLLTTIYAVHYWLKRCVPRVSEAFFIYTNGVENVLYLDTIMRTPHDIDLNIPKAVYSGIFIDENYFGLSVSEKNRNNIFRRCISNCFNCCKCKKRRDVYDVVEDKTYNVGPSRHLSSFAEQELKKITIQAKTENAAVQTGDSLQLSQMNTLNISDSMQLQSLSIAETIEDRKSESATSFDTDFQKHVNELNMLKLLKDVRSEFTPSTSDEMGIGVPKLNAEKELKSYMYESQTQQESPACMPHRTITTTCDVHEIPETSHQAVKRLRFEEECVEIPNEEEDNDQISSIVSEDRKKRDRNLEKNEGNASSGAGRDFKRFWKKGKKTKKKGHISLR